MTVLLDRFLVLSAKPGFYKSAAMRENNTRLFCKSHASYYKVKINMVSIVLTLRLRLMPMTR